MFMDDPVDNRVASALEQFGAELEAILIGPPPTKPAAAPNGESKGPTSSRSPRRPAGPNRRQKHSASLSELADILMQEGIVVRGIDVARVVAVSTGREVTWAA
jgi:hypothetical protein